MALEKGFVTDIREDGWAEVAVQREAGCPHCGAAMSCGAHDAGGQRKVRALNRAGARKGDAVSIAGGSGSLAAAAVVYLVPVGLLILGAALGAHYGERYGLSENTASVLFGVAGVVAGFGLSGLLYRLIIKNARVTPIITGILNEEHDRSCGLDQQY